MNNKVLVSIALSKVFEKSKSYEKCLRVVSKTIRRRNSVDNFGWIELKLFSGIKNSIGIYMSHDEYLWLCHCFIDNLDESYLKCGNRILQYKKYEEKYLLSSVENKKIYGIELTHEELDKVFYMAEWIKFIINNFVPNNISLNHLKTYLLVLILAKSLKNKFKNICPGCYDQSAEHSTCKMKFEDMTDKYVLLENSLNECQADFIEKYEYMKNILDYDEDNFNYDMFRNDEYKIDLALQISEYLDDQFDSMAHELYKVLKNIPLFSL